MVLPRLTPPLKKRTHPQVRPAFKLEFDKVLMNVAPSFGLFGASKDASAEKKDTGSGM